MHTEGKWEVKKESSNRYAINVNDSAIGFLYFYEPAVGIKEAKANAKLIAAAPDLLDACKRFVEAHEKTHQLEKTDVALRLAKAAIEQAT